MALVYDFPSVAARLRRDDFYAPSRVEPVVEANSFEDYLVCYKCNSGIAPSEPRSQGASGTWYVRCPQCSKSNAIV